MDDFNIILKKNFDNTLIRGYPVVIRFVFLPSDLLKVRQHTSGIPFHSTTGRIDFKLPYITQKYLYNCAVYIHLRP